MGVQVKEGAETKDVFDAFGLGKRIVLPRLG
jgi:hypothetical protein